VIDGISQMTFLSKARLGVIFDRVTGTPWSEEPQLQGTGFHGTVAWFPRRRHVTQEVGFSREEELLANVILFINIPLGLYGHLLRLTDSHNVSDYSR
jgi:hypothetical protein